MDFVWIGIAWLCYLSLLWLVHGCEKLQGGR